MQKTIKLLTMCLTLFFTSANASGLPLSQIPRVNGFAIIDNEGEQYIAATDGGLFHSDDHGHTWSPYSNNGLPATLVTTTPRGTVYAFVVTKGLLQLNLETSQWHEVNNEFGSQVLRQLSTTSWTPSRLVALNQYGKFIVSDNFGNDWNRIEGPYTASSDEERRGHALYREKCQTCHGKDGAGENYSLEALSNKDYIMAPALDASAHAWHHTDEALQKLVLEGSTRTSRMVAWKNKGISESDAHDLVAYIKSLWTRRELDCQGPRHMQCMQ
ncbi:MAG: cytochrome c [Gammaproteobacteria bacterium]|nr:cytochrome c [Gammaproteobacteria bacterium]